MSAQLQHVLLLQISQLLHVGLWGALRRRHRQELLVLVVMVRDGRRGSVLRLATGAAGVEGTLSRLLVLRQCRVIPRLHL